MYVPGSPGFGHAIKTYVTGEKIFMVKRKKLSGRRAGPSDRGFKKRSSVFAVSDREITLCECNKVLEYTPETVRLCNCDGIVEINGCGLTVSTYFGNEIKLSGKIECIKFVGYGGK